MNAQQHQFEPSADNTRALRNAFGCFGTGVTVITAQTPAGPLGMTANSFSSLSLDPALVMWSPACASKRHDAFAQAPHFCVHILSSAQFALAEHFATQGTAFDDLDWYEGPLGTPTLEHCLASFHCDTHAIHPAGDHSLILGQVRHVCHGAMAGTGLLFHKGEFGHFKAK